MTFEPLVHEVALKCSVAHAFEVFTSRVDLWWPPTHRRFDRSTLRQEARQGGQLIETSETGEVFVLADVLSCDPPHRITLAWHPGKISQPTHTEITFDARGPHGAFVRVTHSEGAANLGDQTSHRVALFNKGWTGVLAALDTFIQQDNGAEHD